jgi:hypothetical protein
VLPCLSSSTHVHVLTFHPGKNATEAFEDVGHSDEARGMLTKMLVGDFEGGIVRAEPLLHIPPPLTAAQDQLKQVAAEAASTAKAAASKSSSSPACVPCAASSRARVLMGVQDDVPRPARRARRVPRMAVLRRPVGRVSAHVVLCMSWVVCLDHFFWLRVPACFASVLPHLRMER